MSKKDLLNRADGYGKNTVGQTAASRNIMLWLSLDKTVTKKRWEFGLLLSLIVAFTAIMYPEVFDLPWKQGWQFTTVFVIVVIAWAVWRLISPPKGTLVMRFVLILIVGWWVLESLSAGNPVKKWWYTEAESTGTQSVPLKEHQPHLAVRTVYATQNNFVWVPIPGGTKFDFQCPPGVRIMVVHRGNPQGRAYDCDTEPVTLSYALLNLRFGFQSKSSKTIPVEVQVSF